MRLYNCLRFFRFPNKALTRITDDYVFKQVRVAHGFPSSFKNARRVKEMEGTQERARLSREGGRCLWVQKKVKRRLGKK